MLLVYFAFTLSLFVVCSSDTHVHKFCQLFRWSDFVTCRTFIISVGVLYLSKKLFITLLSVLKVFIFGLGYLYLGLERNGKLKFSMWTHLTIHTKVLNIAHLTDISGFYQSGFYKKEKKNRKPK